MDKQKKNNKKMIANETIYKVLELLPIIVSSVFFIINVMKKNMAAMIAIGICLAIFIGTFLIIKIKKVSFYRKAFIMSLMLPTLVFMISLFSGASYSDDFPLMLAVIALSGMFLEPKITFTQTILADIYFVIMYIVHPEKSGGLSQYILCAACFVLASALFSQVIKRGRAFIEMSEQKAEESEQLLNSIKHMGVQLQDNFDKSANKIEISTKGLQQESSSIAESSGLVSDSCSSVQNKIYETKTQLKYLDEGVKQFEIALKENKNNVETMNEHVNVVGGVISESGEVFKTLEEQMQEIAGVAKQISDIAFNLTILSLNASVESAHAGKYGVGFEVLALEMRSLSESSAGFSDRVSEVVKELLEKVDTAAERVVKSKEVFSKSQDVMIDLVDSFNKLNKQFSELYENIESQNSNVSQIDYIFEDLEQKISNMHDSSISNQKTVEEIADVMLDFSNNISEIVKNTQMI